MTQQPTPTHDPHPTAPLPPAAQAAITRLERALANRPAVTK